MTPFGIEPVTFRFVAQHIFNSNALITKCSSLLNTYRVQIDILSEDVVSVPSLRMARYKTGPAETVVGDWNNKFLYQNVTGFIAVAIKLT